MEEFRFHEGPAPSGYSQDFESSLFNDPRHLRLQAPDSWKAFYIIYEKYKILSAAIYFHVNEGEAHSPLKSPYGSVEFSEDISPIILFRFLEFVEARLKVIGVTKITIKDSPADYRRSSSALLHPFLFNLGYTIADAEVGAIIQVTESRFDASLDDWEKRKLRHAAEMRLRVLPISLDQLGETYLFILGCRKQKGYSLSMSLSDLKETAAAFAGDFLMHGVFLHEKLAAASIAIRVRRNVLYNFYSAHAAEFDAVSPVVFLMESIYRYCQDNAISLLDLGTSAVGGQPNFGLLDFKLRLGARPTPKLTFEKNLI